MSDSSNVHRYAALLFAGVTNACSALERATGERATAEALGRSAAKLKQELAADAGPIANQALDSLIEQAAGLAADAAMTQARLNRELATIANAISPSVGQAGAQAPIPGGGFPQQLLGALMQAAAGAGVKPPPAPTEGDNGETDEASA